MRSAADGIVSPATRTWDLPAVTRRWDRRPRALAPDSTGRLCTRTGVRFGGRRSTSETRAHAFVSVFSTRGTAGVEMAEEPKQQPSSRKAVGIYDRPASADFPKRTIL